MPITQFEQTAIDKAASTHNDLSAELRGKLLTLEEEVDNTLAASGSQATRALQSTYEQWFRNVEKMIIDRTTSLTESMKMTAQTQMDVDEENAKGINVMQQFITG
jgi:uncharacterized protein YukE